VTPVESVAAALADEPRPPGVRVSVHEGVTGEPCISLFTADPLHTTVAVVTERHRKNPEQLYLSALAQHERAVANLRGKGAT
jgi:hypothetical protein